MPRIGGGPGSGLARAISSNNQTLVDRKRAKAAKKAADNNLILGATNIGVNAAIDVGGGVFREGQAQKRAGDREVFENEQAENERAFVRERDAAKIKRDDERDPIKHAQAMALANERKSRTPGQEALVDQRLMEEDEIRRFNGFPRDAGPEKMKRGGEKLRLFNQLSAVSPDAEAFRATNGTVVAEMSDRQQLDMLQDLREDILNMDEATQDRIMADSVQFMDQFRPGRPSIINRSVVEGIPLNPGGWFGLGSTPYDAKDKEAHFNTVEQYNARIQEKRRPIQDEQDLASVLRDTTPALPGYNGGGGGSGVGGGDGFAGVGAGQDFFNPPSGEQRGRLDPRQVAAGSLYPLGGQTPFHSGPAGGVPPQTNVATAPQAAPQVAPQAADADPIAGLGHPFFGPPNPRGLLDSVIEKLGSFHPYYRSPTADSSPGPSQFKSYPRRDIDEPSRGEVIGGRARDLLREALDDPRSFGEMKPTFEKRAAEALETVSGALSDPTAGLSFRAPEKGRPTPRTGPSRFKSYPRVDLDEPSRGEAASGFAKDLLRDALGDPKSLGEMKPTTEKRAAESLEEVMKALGDPTAGLSVDTGPLVEGLKEFGQRAAEPLPGVLETLSNPLLGLSADTAPLLEALRELFNSQSPPLPPALRAPFQGPSAGPLEGLANDDPLGLDRRIKRPNPIPPHPLDWRRLISDPWRDAFSNRR